MHELTPRITKSVMKSAKPKPQSLPKKLQEWADVRSRFRLSHAVIQMARELSMRPLDVLTHEKRRIKQGWPRIDKYVTSRYRNRFGKELTDAPPLEEQWAEKKRLQAERKAEKREANLPDEQE